MKKFFTIIPITQPAEELQYAAVDNQKLSMERKVSFPVLTVVNGYAEPGESIELICLTTIGPDNYLTDDQYTLFQKQLGDICQSISIKASVQRLDLDNGESVLDLLMTFRRVIEMIAPGDELFADITFGTKPTAFALLTAIQNAYKMKENTSLGCICYGQFDRATNEAKIYDLTALARMDNIVNAVVRTGAGNVESVIHTMLDI